MSTCNYLIFKIIFINLVFIIKLFFGFRNKVPPRPAGQRTEPDANTVNYQLI